MHSADFQLWVNKQSDFVVVAAVLVLVLFVLVCRTFTRVSADCLFI